MGIAAVGFWIDQCSGHVESARELGPRRVAEEAVSRMSARNSCPTHMGDLRERWPAVCKVFERLPKAVLSAKISQCPSAADKAALMVFRVTREDVTAD